MNALWDTTFASRLNPKAEILDYVIDQAAQGTPVRIAAPSVLEIAYGYELKIANGDQRYRKLSDWFTRLLASDVLSVVPLDGRAALVAGHLRGAIPHPPASRDRRSKTMRQAAWILDIQIASVAFAAGLDVATMNRIDFGVLSDALRDLYPDASRLEVFGQTGADPVRP